MDIEFDPAKDAANRDRHGVPLAFGVSLFDDPAHLVLSSLREIDGEERFKVVGSVDGRLWTAIYVWRGAVCRFVSVRKSNGKEAREYEDCD
jgi:uncharacterized DUF497 family protein